MYWYRPVFINLYCFFVCNNNSIVKSPMYNWRSKIIFSIQGWNRIELLFVIVFVAVPLIYGILKWSHILRACRTEWPQNSTLDNSMFSLQLLCKNCILFCIHKCACNKYCNNINVMMGADLKVAKIILSRTWVFNIFELQSWGGLGLWALSKRM